MTASITTAETAARVHLSVRTVRAWCRTGRLPAVKSHGRWAIAPSAVARLLCPASDRPRKGEHAPVPTGRTARRQFARAEARRVAGTHRARVVGHVDRARIAAATAGYFLCRDYLAGLGFDAEFVSRYESAFGREVAKQYRINHGCEPDNGGMVVLRGRLWRANRYRDVADLLAGARAYKRTAVVLVEREVQALGSAPVAVVA